MGYRQEPGLPPEGETTAGASRVPRDYRIATPANWFDLDLSPGQSERAISRVVEEQAGGHPPEVRRQLTSLLQQVAAQAGQRGAVFASLCSETLQGFPISASLLVSVTPPQGPAEPDLDELAERLRNAPSDTPLLSIEQLQAGPALRLQRRTTAEPPATAARSAEVESLQYFVPIPGTARLLVLSFSTPNLPLAEAFVDLFDAIAESLHWRW